MATGVQAPQVATDAKIHYKPNRWGGLLANLHRMQIHLYKWVKQITSNDTVYCRNVS